MTPLLSIVTITYNHEPFIAKTIEGVLMQQVNFPIELIIAEDCSTDGTRAICQRYAEQYPELIRLITSEFNVGAVVNERRAMLTARGKYIAFCEGDDYWTDPLKLQRQVDFLEAHPDYSVTFHRYQIYSRTQNVFKEDDCGFLFTTDDVEGVEITMHMFLHRWVTQYLTMVFRKDAFDTALIDSYKHFRDTHIMYHLIRNGKCYLYAFVGGVYNMTDAGIYSVLSNRQIGKMTLAVDKEIWKVNKDDRMRDMYLIVMQNQIDILHAEKKYSLSMIHCAFSLLWHTHNLKKWFKNMYIILFTNNL